MTELKPRIYENGIEYILVGDYYIPNLRPEHPEIRLGKYGMLRKTFLKDHRPILYSQMALNETLYPHCAEIEEAARTRLDLIMTGLARNYGITEKLKAENNLEWARQMNACKAQAEEVIFAELIYC